jgi:hypothetical protein
MKKQGPPPCGMYNVGSLLAAFTNTISRRGQPSRTARERQLRGLPPSVSRSDAQTFVLTLAPTELNE